MFFLYWFYWDFFLFLLLCFLYFLYIFWIFGAFAVICGVLSLAVCAEVFRCFWFCALCVQVSSLASVALRSCSASRFGVSELLASLTLWCVVVFARYLRFYVDSDSQNLRLFKYFGVFSGESTFYHGCMYFFKPDCHSVSFFYAVSHVFYVFLYFLYRNFLWETFYYYV